MPNTKPVHDGQIHIATGSSRWAAKWKNQTMSWSDFLQKISVTTLTRETVEEYKKLPKTQQDAIKDVGGFVGGWLKQGQRKAGSLEHRSLITLDADFATMDLLDNFSLIYGNAAAVYSTHKHTPEAPRLRLIVPLSRTVTADEYQAAARKLAQSLGMDLFDDTTYQPTRLMYWPSTSTGGVYVFDTVDGPFLDPDTLLAQYPDWRDTSYWPESSRCAGVRQKAAERQGDPRTKPGMVGAFCRCYDIDTAIERFLPDKYTTCSMPGRYTFTSGSTAAGLVVYDDGLFAYSNHATDPTSGRLCNAFDLVRIHLFGFRDDGSDPDTPVNKLPSFVAMTDLAREDEEVKVLVTRERLEAAKKDFEAPPEDAEGDGWMKDLTVTKKGLVEDTVANIRLILANDPALKGALAYNAFRGRQVIIRSLPWHKVRDTVNGDIWGDVDDSQLREYLATGYGIDNKGHVYDATNNEAQDHAFHPVTDFLDGLEWDGVERLDTLLVDYLGADDTPYTRAVTRKAFTAAVARAYRPGCKFDYILVLSGPQGRGKSTLIAKMSRGWFTDSLAGIGTKEAYEGIQGFWLVELGELAAMRKTEIEVTKNFISKQVDSYRAAYGRRTEDHPRQCVFFGTTNSTAFLRDDTGNRRFWPIRLQDEAPLLTVWDDLTDEVIAQLWAEACFRYKAGEPLTLPHTLTAAALEQQEQFTEDDARRGLVEQYVDTLLPENWKQKGREERQHWFADAAELREKGTQQRITVCAAEVWAECMQKDPANFPRQEKRDISAILCQLSGWKEEPGRQKCGPYGLQVRYFRVSGGGSQNDTD